jgi:hypothetical protein
MKFSYVLLAGTALILTVPAFAQNSGSATPQTPAANQGGMMMGGGMQGGMMQGGMMMQGMGPMLGQHMMNVTVTGIDAKTGLIDVSAGSMAMKLHFPPASLAGVKVGDKISVHLAFHKQ